MFKGLVDAMGKLSEILMKFTVIEWLTMNRSVRHTARMLESFEEKLDGINATENRAKNFDFIPKYYSIFVDCFKI